jgi:transposase
MCKGKDKASIASLVENYTGRENVKVVVIDLSSSYRSIVHQLFPNAKIVADKFHALRLLNPALMKLRKQINGNRLELKQRRLLLRNREDLKYFDKRELDCFLEKHPDLEELYFYKERLRVFYQSRNTRQAISYINLFIGDLENSAIEAAQVLGRTLKRWQAPLVEYFRNRWTNGFTEATNGNAKALQKRARGFKNFVNYRAKTLNACFY